MDEDDSYDISVARECGQIDLDDSSVTQAVRATLQREGCSRATVSVALVTDDRIAELNQTYLDRAGPTDVLSFNLGDKGECADGEIIVSVDTARRESAARGVSLTAEIQLYLVHGVLHLLGYEDGGEPEARRMHEIENEILMTLGAGGTYGAGD